MLTQLSGTSLYFDHFIYFSKLTLGNFEIRNCILNISFQAGVLAQVVEGQQARGPEFKQQYLQKTIFFYSRTAWF
jgi:hypothetical protein